MTAPNENCHSNGIENFGLDEDSPNLFNTDTLEENSLNDEGSTSVFTSFENNDENNDEDELEQKSQNPQESLLSKLDNFEISVSHTTRKPRAKEIPDKDYYFVEENEFERLIKNQEFLEYAKVFNNFYGTTRTPVINNLNKGKNVLFDIDWQGADQIKNKKLDYKLITFFILPPSKEVLFKRLSSRDMKDKLIAEERMKQFGRDLLHWINYDYVVILSLIHI